METTKCAFCFSLLFLPCLLLNAEGQNWNLHLETFNRSIFPAGFVFGAASSSYQSEGAANVDGRGASIWDVFTHEDPAKIQDHSTGDVADALYFLYKKDIMLMKSIGLDAFRFSISWPRLFPDGKISSGVNPKGVKFYNNLIDDLLSYGLQPYVTLFHWDLPQALDHEYGGFLSPQIVDDYLDYVDFCFKTFGDRVKHWLTLNEPYEFTVYGYGYGIYAPGRCSSYIGNCTSGDSATEPYKVGHHLMLSHAAAVKLYRDKYKAYQKGQIGVTLSSKWFVPFSENEASLKAAQRALDFQLGWFLHPITYGDYPWTMRSLVGKRLPKFTKEEAEMLKKSYDFVGLNYYTSNFAADGVFFTNLTRNLSVTTDSRVSISMVKNGNTIGLPTPLSWLYVCPEGLRALVLHIKDNYDNPTICITENGVAEENNNTLSIKEALQDWLRILYHSSHLSHLHQAIEEGANVKGYFIWSFLDDFEWALGYTARFGITFVDYENGLRRYSKRSAF
ncbi:Beta-glucosidase, partial [Bertholletia excelsa]